MCYCWQQHGYWLILWSPKFCCFCGGCFPEWVWMEFLPRALRRSFVLLCFCDFVLFWFCDFVLLWFCDFVLLGFCAFVILWFCAFVLLWGLLSKMSFEWKTVNGVPACQVPSEDLAFLSRRDIHFCPAQSQSQFFYVLLGFAIKVNIWQYQII